MSGVISSHAPRRDRGADGSMLSGSGAARPRRCDTNSGFVNRPKPLHLRNPEPCNEPVDLAVTIKSGNPIPNLDDSGSPTSDPGGLLTEPDLQRTIASSVRNPDTEQADTIATAGAAVFGAIEVLRRER